MRSPDGDPTAPPTEGAATGGADAGAAPWSDPRFAGPPAQGPDPSGPPGSYPPGSYPPGPYPPGPYPPGSYPPGSPPPDPPPPGPPGWAATTPPRRHHSWGLGAFLLAEVVFLLTSFLILSPTVREGGEPSILLIGASIALPTLLAATTAVVATIVRGNGPRIDLGLVWSWRDLGIGVAFGFGGLLLTTAAAAVYVSVVGPDASSAVGDVFAGLRAGPLEALFIGMIVVLVAPLCEEILYRGLLWGGLEKLGAGRWTAFAITTLVFALAHFELTRTPLLLVISIPIGLARLYTGRLLASVVAHQINNLLPGVVLVLGLLGLVPMV